MEDVTFIVHGDIYDPPDFGLLKQYPRTPANSTALYEGRLAAMQEVTTPYFCLLDGGEDRLLPVFAGVIQQQIRLMRASGAGMGISLETSGRRGHHAVLCDTRLAKKLRAPKGLHHFETLFYRWLRPYGVIVSDEITYDWKPTPNGARHWPDTLEAMSNSYLYISLMKRNKHVSDSLGTPS